MIPISYGTMTMPKPLAAKTPTRYSALELVNIACAAMGLKYTDVFVSNPTGFFRRNMSSERASVLRCVFRIEDHLSNPVTVESVSQATGLCPSAIHLIKAGTGAAKDLVSLADIIAATCGEIQIVPSEMATKTRHPRVVWTRRIVTILARDHTQSSFPHIARAIGAPNHSSIITTKLRAEKCLAELPRGDKRRLTGEVGKPGSRDAADVIEAVKGRLGITSEST